MKLKFNLTPLMNPALVWKFDGPSFDKNKWSLNLVLLLIHTLQFGLRVLIRMNGGEILSYSSYKLCSLSGVMMVRVLTRLNGASILS